MMKSLLQDRFRATWHLADEPTKVLELIVGKGGMKIRPPDPAKDPMAPDNTVSACPADVNGCLISPPRTISMDDFALSMPAVIFGRPLVNKTGLSGTFVVPAMTLILAGESSATVPSATTTLRDATGLELRPATDLRPVLVIDHVERP